MVLVLRDRELAQIAQFQQLALGRKSCSELPDYDLAAICRGVGLEHMILRQNSEVDSVLGQALTMTRSGRAVVVEVAIDHPQKTYFTRGVVRTNSGRLPRPDRKSYVLRGIKAETDVGLAKPRLWTMNKREIGLCRVGVMIGFSQQQER
jgi:hypothetical protein